MLKPNGGLASHSQGLLHRMHVRVVYVYLSRVSIPTNHLNQVHRLRHRDARFHRGLSRHALWRTQGLLRGVFGPKSVMDGAVVVRVSNKWAKVKR
jgi:hypothetical protein